MSQMPDASTPESAAAYARAYARRAARLLEQLDAEAIEAMAGLILGAYQQGRAIYCVGNGGSAATASHFATDLAWGHRQGIEAPPRVISLSANAPMMTAVGNDVGYAEIFVEQMRGAFQAGDVLVAISASGNSENLLRAARLANAQGGATLGLVGFDGGRLKALCAACLHVATPRGEYELVEDVHHSACHMIARFVKQRIAAAQAGSPRERQVEPVL